MEEAIKQYQAYLSKTDKKNLFDDDEGSRKISLQVCLHKIPNLINNKQILCKLPHSLHKNDNLPEICLIVKDLDKKDRDFDKTVRKYKAIVEKNGLDSLVKHIIPLKQLNLEFRPFEAKRKLCTSFDLFVADKSLHDILFNGSKLGKEFRKRRKMPFEVDLENVKDLKDSLQKIINSTLIRLTGSGSIIDINAFLSTHTVQQAVENIQAIKSELVKHLPGGESNIKSIYLKSTNEPGVPIYLDTEMKVNEIKLEKNLTPRLIKKAKRNKTKRLGKSKPV